MKTKIFMSLMVVAMVAALIGGATMAWFTDSASSETVSFQAGTLLIEIQDEGIVTQDINLDILNPGDEFEYTFNVANVGTKNLIYAGVMCYQDILGNTLNDFGNRDEYGTKGLSEVLELEISVGNNTFYTGSLAGYVATTYPDESTGFPQGLSNPNALVFGEAGPLAPGDVWPYTIKVTLPKEAGNEFQGSKLNAAFTLLARQASYADESKYPEFECPLLDLFPSTNYLNQNNMAPLRVGQGAPYVELVSVNDNEVTLNFVNPNNYLAVFEYRVDGQVQTVGTLHDSAPHYDFIADDEVMYDNNVQLPSAGSSQLTITGVTDKVEVRHAAGAESDFFFDWTLFLK